MFPANQRTSIFVPSLTPTIKPSPIAVKLCTLVDNARGRSLGIKSTLNFSIDKDNTLTLNNDDFALSNVYRIFGNLYRLTVQNAGNHVILHVDRLRYVGQQQYRD